MPKRKSTKRSPRTRLNKQVLLLAGLVALLVGLSIFTYSQIYDDTPADDITLPDSSSQDGEYINLDPPTEQDKQDVEANKQNLESGNQTPPEQTADGKTKVTPLITSASGSEVLAYVPGIFEEGGKCTATATKGSQTKTSSSTGFTNVNYTSCGPISWNLSGGGWSVVVSYNSNKASGKSEPEMVD